MKPRLKIAETRAPDGSEMVLYQHDRDFFMMLNGQDLMDSRQKESELELARLGCRHLAARKDPSVLIGGLGMGYTLRQTLDMLGPDGRVVVGELVDAVVEWNRTYLGVLNGHPIEDPRVNIESGDIVDIIARCSARFDAILIDIDNGPDAMTTADNHRLYGSAGIQACRRALVKNGCLAVWSADPSKKYEQLLVQGGFHVRRYRVPASKGSSSPRFVWVASEDQKRLPPGGGEPRPSERKKASIRNRRRSRKNRFGR